MSLLNRILQLMKCKHVAAMAEVNVPTAEDCASDIVQPSSEALKVPGSRMRFRPFHLRQSSLNKTRAVPESRLTGRP